MALSFKEKRGLTKIVNAKIAEIETGGLKFKEKRAATKELNDALEKLNAKIEAGVGSPLLDDLVAGKFNDLPPLRFIVKLEEVVKSLDGEFKPVIEPTIAYCKINAEDPDTQVLESAVDEAFGMGLGLGNQQGMGDDAIRIMPLGGPGNSAPKQIAIDIDSDFSEPINFRRIIRVLEMATDGDEITLKILSPGGRTDTAQAVYVALLETKAKTTAKILKAYSSGSIVAMACDKIVTTPFCSMMVHNASSMTQGKVNDMATQSSYQQDFYREWYEQLYAGFMTKEEIKDAMKGQDFWFKESEIQARLKNWQPIRERVKADGSIEAV